MNKLYLLLLLAVLSNCQTEKLIENYYIIRLSKTDKGYEKEESVIYFLIKNDLKRIVDISNKANFKNINSIKSLIIDEYNGLPILDHSMKYWEISCLKSKLQITPDEDYKNISQDSLKSLDIYNQLIDRRMYFTKSITLNKPIAYKVDFGITKVKSLNYCKILWTKYVLDSTIILRDKFKIEYPTIPLTID